MSASERKCAGMSTHMCEKARGWARKCAHMCGTVRENRQEKDTNRENEPTP